MFVVLHFQYLPLDSKIIVYFQFVLPSLQFFFFNWMMGYQRRQCMTVTLKPFMITQCNKN